MPYIVQSVFCYVQKYRRSENAQNARKKYEKAKKDFEESSAKARREEKKGKNLDVSLIVISAFCILFVIILFFFFHVCQ